ncbi:MAG: amidohydrolase [bacterium]
MKRKWCVIADTWREPKARIQRLAVEIEGERIVRIAPPTEAFFLKDAMVFPSPALLIPAFHDSHAHLMTGGLSLDWVSLGGIHDVDETAARLEAAARESDGHWLDGCDFDPALLSLDRWTLDKIVRDIPVFIRSHDLHSALVNSATLALAGIDDNVVDPPGGCFERDADGKLNGLVRERACDFILSFRPPLGKAQAQRALLRSQSLAFSRGITAVSVSVCADWVPFYVDFMQSSESRIRLNLWKETADFDYDGERFDPLEETQFRYATFKGYVDGALGSQTAALWEPYTNNPDNRGILTVEEEKLTRFVQAAAGEGYQVALHAIGDRACTIALNAFAAAKGPENRLRLEHAQILRREDIHRLAGLGVIASMQPIHATADMRWVEERIGLNRARFSYAWRSIRDAGAHLCFGSDWPVETMNPLEGLYAAVTRRDRDGNPAGGWIPEQCLTMEEALEAYTQGAAYAAKWENEVGTISEGRLADLAVLSCNPFRCEPRELLQARVLMTVCGGTIVYRSDFEFR